MGGDQKGSYIHEMGRVCNICSDYGYTIEVGLEQRAVKRLRRLENSGSGELKAVSFLESAIRAIDDIERLACRMLISAQIGKRRSVPCFDACARYGARSFHEALQFFRILHFSLWASGNYHNTVGVSISIC
jgi:formate C-acetyltransferase